jgi:hypothetical protein
MMLNYLINNLHFLGVLIISCLGFYLVRKNKNITLKNEELIKVNLEQNKIIDIQTKVLNVSENVKPTDLDVNLERLSDKSK